MCMLHTLPRFYESYFFCRRPRGWNSGGLHVCVSVTYPFMTTISSLFFPLALLHLSEILINNHGSTMLRCPVMGS